MATNHWMAEHTQRSIDIVRIAAQEHQINCLQAKVLRLQNAIIVLVALLVLFAIPMLLPR